MIQINGIRIKDDLVLLAAVGINGYGLKHSLGVLEGATANESVVQARAWRAWSAASQPEDLQRCQEILRDGRVADVGSPQAAAANVPLHWPAPTS
jgi:hypothetical protein